MFLHIYAARRPLFLMFLCLVFVPMTRLALIGVIGFWMDFCMRFRESLLLSLYQEMIDDESRRSTIKKRALLRYKLQQSWCGRGILIVHYPEDKDRLHKLGYRIWHILPDGNFKQLMSRKFWKSAIGI